MAKKRKTKKRKGRRIGRASSLNLTPSKKENLMRAAGVIAGVVGARFLETYATKQLTTLTTNMVSGMEVGLGAVVTIMADNPLLQGIGMGIVGAGGANLAKGMGLVAGVGSPIVFPTRRVGTTNGSGIPMIGQPYYNMPRVGNSGRNMFASVGKSRVGDIDYGGTFG